ncbi:tRNA 2-selenouridine(34) synthase MnmH [Verminephrobacter eiseniae]|uniref:tRNA 2-selenouridine(34) synthase MnmH n=1 Tax=Verminephrobacter eiseniae TaxID=364317 RepID=UPI002237529B|nr:tRNA 2-selenouridine(34) synthase MnmH [Verminephrobacter eiseniae]MCW5234379.1 tRNA 2-selenouridine(34) synthase MnmH [Verminephrobacter eiseniae]MCW5294045.1 tRNA 2-selenouridine(34) synthase MnmH [Verminephrobacter eiseniae]MCW8183217.1 tRNA 2-selenouridine(34) synthase MnmH [Verminephrobacter eiseniae]MCW8222158.1 tRNA 2-selenouridine(34) synthase MnmH [Verminephrobacter eiseniae]MCW8232752.1 tRNA 2-selenouridine(34) synthase MnmH [Verminephrobacter eiseniae]
MRQDDAQLRHIFLHDVPLLDVRAPVEFAQGAFPGAVNHPLMDDAERHQVGLCYRQQGQPAAIALGQQLVSGHTRRERIAAWAAFAQAHPDGLLYCLRGGLRSQIALQWLHSEAGIAYPRVPGGYKALRMFLIDTTQAASQECDFVLLSGLTGTGKTALIAQLAQGLDLEGHANHRGSSFGQRLDGQPSQVDFEHRLAIDILKKQARGHRAFVLEDEGRHVGRCSVPLALRQRLERAPIVCLQDSFGARVERIVGDYVVGQCADFVAAHGPALGFERFSTRLLDSLGKLARRLGGARYQQLHADMQAALARQQASGDIDLHRHWIAALMRDYYDPMYAFQRQSRPGRIVFEGDLPAVLAYLRAGCG